MTLPCVTFTYLQGCKSVRNITKRMCLKWFIWELSSLKQSLIFTYCLVWHTYVVNIHLQKSVKTQPWYINLLNKLEYFARCTLVLIHVLLEMDIKLDVACCWAPILGISYKKKNPVATAVSCSCCRRGKGKLQDPAGVSHRWVCLTPIKNVLSTCPKEKVVTNNNSSDRLLFL